MNNPIAFQFMQFMNQMKGRDPNAIINNLLSSGKVNQQQINQAHQQAQQIKSQLEGIKKNFGFQAIIKSVRLDLAYFKNTKGDYLCL